MRNDVLIMTTVMTIAFATADSFAREPNLTRRRRRERSSITRLVLGFGAFSVIVAVATPSGATPLPGDLDPAFGNHGSVTMEQLGRSATIEAIALQPDGKIIAAGETWEQYKSRIAVIRLRNNGTLDRSFGGDGIVTTRVTHGDHRQDLAYDVAIQSDGKIVVAGVSGSQRERFTLVRYNTDGSLDATFGDHGVVITNFSPGSSRRSDDAIAYALTIEPSGSILAAGQTSSASGFYDYALARYTTDGDLDTTFGHDGRVVTDLGEGSADLADGLEETPDGMIIVAGQSGPAFEAANVAIVRYTPDGSLDTAFGGGDGVVTTDLTAWSDHAHDVALQADGKIVVAGVKGFPLAVTPDTSNSASLVIRYTRDGVLDRSFGTSGIVAMDLAVRPDAYEEFRAVALAANGDVLAAGHSGRVGTLVRLDADGSPDASFGTDGVTRTRLSHAWQAWMALALQPDGEIVTGGGQYFGVARFRG